MKKEEENKKIKNKKMKIIILLIILVFTVLGVILTKFRKEDIETVKKSVVMVEAFDENGELMSTGSGFCTYKENYIITNFHVIQGARNIKIIDDERKEYDIKKIELFISSDDIAILSGDFSFKPIKIDKSELKVGENVTAIGSPQGELNTVSNGIISNLDDDYQIRMTAPISPGSSGGVLLNDKNKVIGITYATYNSIEAQNINYAIKVDYLEKVYEYLESGDAFPLPNKTMYSDLNDFVQTGKNKEHIYYYVDSLENFYKATSVKNIFGEVLKKEDLVWYDEYEKLTEKGKNECIKILEDFQNEYQEMIEEKKGKFVKISEAIKEYSKEELLYMIFFKKYQYAILLAKLNENSGDINEIIASLPLKNGEKTIIKYALYYGDISKFSDTENKEFTDYIIKDKFSSDSDSAIALLKTMGYRVEENANTYRVHWN